MDKNVPKRDHSVIVEPDEIVGAVNKENINQYTTTLLVAVPTRTLIRVLRCRTGGIKHAGLYWSPKNIKYFARLMGTTLYQGHKDKLPPYA